MIEGYDMELVGIYSSGGTLTLPNWDLDLVPWYLNFNTEYLGFMSVDLDSNWSLSKSANFCFQGSNLVLGDIYKDYSCRTPRRKNSALDRFNLDVEPNFILTGTDDLYGYDKLVNVFLLLDEHELSKLDKHLNRKKQKWRDKLVLSLT